ncbi:type II secretion system major pseudopilin GspG [Pectobacterium cacticida]|uniref:Type II secretion system core protein G n=1 Tax=Pectobacterium cacticida TaxID=69221 RepID=A0ABZ2G9H4_9GAMM|nr:type II secretion system major pseudopilin GspG [Pectobacterium cacticida]UYX07970.1 type II secretion system major pseudopilin GspG [Pectobacterium cacticida]
MQQSQHSYDQHDYDQRSYDRHSDGQRGFTLLEIMVVIVILGVLASLVVPNLMGNKEKADRQKAISDIVSLESALDMYKLDNNRYPSTEQGLQALVTKPTVQPEPRNYPADGYIRRLPQDPWGGDYQLLNPGQHSKLDIFSLGPDGLPGTEDDIGNWNLDKK